MVKLRLNCASQDLAYHFRISTTTALRILNTSHWLNIMDTSLKSLIFWQDREFRDALRKTMSDCFQVLFVVFDNNNKCYNQIITYNKVYI